MKRKIKLNALKKTKDHAVREQLSEQFPADWEMNHIFEASYQKYLVQRRNMEKYQQESERSPIRKHYHYQNYLITAVCLVLAFGTVGTLFFLKRFEPESSRIADREPETVTAPVTESLPEETNASETEHQTETVLVSEIMPETTMISETSDFFHPETTPFTSEPTEPQTSVSETEMMSEASEEIFMEEVLPLETEPITEPTEPVTEPEMLFSENVPEIAESEESDTEISETTEDITSETAIQTETTPETEALTPETSETGLRMMEQDDGTRAIGYYWGDDSFSEGLAYLLWEVNEQFALLEYTLNLDGFSMTRTTDNTFLITDHASEETYQISVSPHWWPVMTGIRETTRADTVSVNGEIAYLVFTGDFYMDDCMVQLVWDNGDCICHMTGMYTQRETLITIAEAFQSELNF